MHRLVLRVRESPGIITVYEDAEEPVAPQTASAEVAKSGPTEAATPEAMRSSFAKEDAESSPEAKDPSRSDASAAAVDEWYETVELSGELIAAVERAAVGLGTDFSALFREARVALADDYTFLDPMAGLQYENALVRIDSDSAPAGYVTGIGEVLRRIVDQFATGEKARRARERVALELARVARKNGEALTRTGFHEQLDRIAGTKVV